MKPVKFGTRKPAAFSAAGVKRFADTSFDFGHNVGKKKSKGGSGKKRKSPAGGGS